MTDTPDTNDDTPDEVPAPAFPDPDEYRDEREQRDDPPSAFPDPDEHRDRDATPDDATPDEAADAT